MEGHPVDKPHDCICDDVLNSLRKAHLAGKPSADLHSHHGLYPLILLALARVMYSCTGYASGGGGLAASLSKLSQ